MMIELARPILILAEGDGTEHVIQIVFFVVIALGSIISALVKKSAEAKNKEQARQKAEEAKAILARRAQREKAMEAQQTHRPIGPEAFSRKQVSTQAVSLRDFIQKRGSAKTTKPKPSMFAAPPKPVPAEDHHLVDLTPIQHLPPEEELIHPNLPSSKHERKRKTAVADLIRKRKPAPTPVEPNVPAENHFSPLADTNVHTRVDLSDPATARAAIIFQEILSPPKALRKGAEMWD